MVDEQTASTVVFWCNILTDVVGGFSLLALFAVVWRKHVTAWLWAAICASFALIAVALVAVAAVEQAVVEFLYAMQFCVIGLWGVPLLERLLRRLDDPYDLP